MCRKPFGYFCLVVLAVFILPNDTFANNGKSVDKAESLVNEVSKSPKSAAEKVSQKAEKDSGDSENNRRKTAKKDVQSANASAAVSNGGKQISEKTADQENVSNKDHTKSATLNKAVSKASESLPSQASDQAAEHTDKFKQEAASKGQAVKKKVENNLSAKKVKPTKSADNKKEELKRNKQKISLEKMDAEGHSKPKEPEKPVKLNNPERELKRGKETRQPSIRDSKEKKVQKKIKQGTQAEKTDSDQQEKEKPLPKQNPKELPFTWKYIMKTVSLPSPVSTNGGDLGSQTSFSSMVKGNLPGDFPGFNSGSQIIGKRFEFLRDQWVNAPPVGPPKTAS